MNIAQQILDLILRMMHYEDFKSSFTQKENDFIYAIRSSSLNYFRISSLHNRQTIFTWNSKMGESVACHVGGDGFYFSSAVAYKDSTKRMKDREEEKLLPIKQAFLDDEIIELKKIFKTYFGSDVEVYFK